MNKIKEWDWQIQAEQKWFRINLSELLEYKDLLLSLVRREMLSSYSQTVLGMFWILIQPIFVTLFYVLVFGNIVKVSTAGIPPVLFYMSGAIIWSFFSDTLNGAMYSFVKNAHIFNKIYFPRLLVPLSLFITYAIRNGVQLVLFFILVVIFGTSSTATFSLLALIPVLFMLAGLVGFSIGLLVSVYMAKYRDLEQLVLFVLRLFMFITPVVYPAAMVSEKYSVLFWANPLTPIIETFRAILFQHDLIHVASLVFAVLTTIALLITSLVLFKKKEIKIIDNI
ncbi:MAG TPA: ABC transporter permease [Flavipsychrobacter sp.]|nr:ABC transporter permease [Flavipsychrobacter sp.]